MKITYLYQTDGQTLARPSAPRVHVFSIIQGLQRLGHQTKLMTLYGRGTLFTDDLESVSASTADRTKSAYSSPLMSRGYRLFESGVRRVQTSTGSPYLGLFDSHRIYEACRRTIADCDVIHERANLQGIGGAVASRRLGVPLVLEFNGDSIDELEKDGKGLRGVRLRYAQWSTRFALASAAKVISVSTSLKDYLVKAWHVDASKIIVLPNGADTDRFGRSYDTRSLRASLGLGDELVIVWIGGFYKWHDLTLLVQSFASLHQVFPRTKLLLVGDGQSLPQIRSEIARLNLQENVICTGRVDHDKIPQLLALADIAVAPLRDMPEGYGCSPLKLYEYMAAGKPIVASGLGQIGEVVSHGDTGLLVEPGDGNELTAAITTLLADSTERSRLGRNARQQAVVNHSWDAYVRRLEDIYYDVLDKQGSTQKVH